MPTRGKSKPALVALAPQPQAPLPCSSLSCTHLWEQEIARGLSGLEQSPGHDLW